MSAEANRSIGRRTGKSAGALVLLAMVLVVAACGGRRAEPIPVRTDLDPQFNCAQLTAQRSFLVRRIAELEDERNFNRARTLSRLPGALIGSPISAIVLADPSVAIYQEIEAAEERDVELARLQEERGCNVEAPGAPEEPAAPITPFGVDDYQALGATDV